MKKMLISLLITFLLSLLVNPVNGIVWEYDKRGNKYLKIVKGTLWQDTVWEGEILVEENVMVQPGVTLTVMPGTRVRFKHYRGYREPQERLSINIQGTIIAEGTFENPIYFTSDALDPCNGDWSMIHVESVEDSTQAVFRYCVFEFGLQGLNVWHSSPILSHCVFRWNNYEGIYFESYCESTIEHSRIVENGYNGLACEQFNAIMMDSCEVWRNGTNGVHVDASEMTIYRSYVYNNIANGLSVDDNGILRALGLEINNNHSCGIGCGEGNNLIELSNITFSSNLGGDICGPYTEIPSSVYPPDMINFSFQPDTSYSLGYIPGDYELDRYMYVFPNDETRRIIKKIGQGLGLPWSLAWDGQNIWTATLGGRIYKLDPQSSDVVQQFDAPGSQPWGMTFDGEYLWLVDFAEKRISKLDPSSGEELTTYPTPDSIGGCKGVTWDGNYLNVMGWTSDTIYRMDRQGNLVETIALELGGSGGIAWDGHHFWIPAGGRILKYDTIGHAVGWIYPASDGTWDMTWDGQYLWASQRTNENWADAKIFQLEILDDHDYRDQVWYVSTKGSDITGDGSNSNPFATIQNAVDRACSGVTIYTAEGIYDENLFVEGKDLNIYGGYENTNWTRDIYAFESIIDGGGRATTVQIKNSSTVIDGFTIQHGQSGDHGGGGIETIGGAPEIKNCTIKNNHAIGVDDWGGGGIALSGGIPKILNCYIIENHSPGGAGGIRSGYCDISINNSVIAHNTGQIGIHFNNVTGSIINCTIAGNPSGGLGFNSSPVTVINSIEWHNNMSSWGDLYYISYSNIEGGSIGTGNTNHPPLFVDEGVGDYQLQDDSPCINAGTPDTTGLGLPEIDLAGNPRIFSTRIDMGSYEHQFITSVVQSNSDFLLPQNYALHQNYPNPFNRTTAILYDLPGASRVVLKIYDIHGQEVKTLIDEYQNPGNKSVIWNGKNNFGQSVSSGIYLYRLESAHFIKTNILLLIK